MKAAYDAFTNEVMYATEHPDEPIGSAKKAKENPQISFGFESE